jgi:TLC ATP/ADP transporter
MHLGRLPQSGFRAGVVGTSCLRARQPAAKRTAPVAAMASSSAAVAEDPDEKPGFLGIANVTWKKIVPLGFMFFAILFNYTILRDTKVRNFSRRQSAAAIAPSADQLQRVHSGGVLTSCNTRHVRRAAGCARGDSARQRR